YTILNQIEGKVAGGSALVTALDGSVIHSPGGGVVGGTNAIYVSYTTDLTNLRNQQFEAFETCSNAQQLNQTLNSYDFKHLFSDLNTAQKEISEITALANDLSNLVAAFTSDNALKNNPPRCSGFDCVAQLKAYADGVKVLIGDTGYQRKLNDLRQK